VLESDHLAIRVPSGSPDGGTIRLGGENGEYSTALKTLADIPHSLLEGYKVGLDQQAAVTFLLNSGQSRVPEDLRPSIEAVDPSLAKVSVLSFRQATAGTGLFWLGYRNAEAKPLDDEAVTYCRNLGEIIADRFVHLQTAADLQSVNRELTITKAAQESSEMRFRQLFQDSAEAIYISDFEGRLRELNPAAQRLFGLSSLELGSVRAKDLYANPKDRQRFQIALEKEGMVRDFPVVLKKRDGTHMECLLTSSLRRDSQGRAVGYQGIIRDVSHEKAQQRRLDAQMDLLKSLHRIDQAITGTTDANLTYDVLLTEVTRSLEFDAADLLLADQGAGWLVFGAGKGFRTAALQHTRLRFGEGSAGQAALERQEIHIPDLKAEPATFSRSPFFEKEDFQSYCGLPLIAKGRVCGVLEGFFRSPRQLSAEWWEMAKAFASQAAIAIDNATLFSNLQRTNIDLVQAYDATLEGWARAHDLRDFETVGHSKRVAEMTIRLASSFDLPEKDLIHIHRGALLHDIGKMAVPDSILKKNGSLSEDEWEIMRQHPLHAARFLNSITYLQPAMAIPLYHHERWDGSGYPEGLAGEDIPMAARIFAVIDVWDALRSDRPYRPAWGYEKVINHLEQERGKHFDPSVVDAFMELADEFDRSYTD
jgi:PAS domain S-box-containing protein